MATSSLQSRCSDVVRPERGYGADLGIDSAAIASRSLECSLIVVGDEILQGFVADTNTAAIATALRETGAHLDAVEIVGDQVDAIAGTVQRMLAGSAPRLLLVVGGTGYTPDDVTHPAIGRALDLPLIAHPAVLNDLRRVFRQAQESGLPLDNESRCRISAAARIPVGAQVHRCEGWVGAVEVPARSEGNPLTSSVVTLPGVPRHMQAVLDEIVVPQILRDDARPFWDEIRHNLPEVSLSPLTEMLECAYSTVHIGSYPGEPSILRVHGCQSEVEAVTQRLRAELTGHLQSC